MEETMKKDSLFLRVLFVFFLSIFISFSARAGKINIMNGKEHHAPDRSYDVLNYTLKLSFDPPNKKLFGKEFITLTPFKSGLDSVVLDAGEMEINTVKLSPGKILRFRKEPEHLIVYLNKPYSSSDTVKIAIDYVVEKPKKGLFFILPGEGSSPEYFEIYSQGEMEDNHYWFPCWDYPNDRATSEIFITTKIPNIAISNGKLVEVIKNQKDSTRTFHWKMSIPHVSYLISIIVGNYVKVEDHYKNISVQYYVHPDQKLYARPTFGRTPEIIQFFSEKIGYDYPYSKYAQSVVDNPMFGGMENITATTLTSGALRDRRSLIDGTSESLTSHELSHQWWGDLLTCRDWTSAWLNEGFATYFASLWTEKSEGKDAFDYEMKRAARIYMSEDSLNYRRPLVWYKYNNPMDMFDRHAYQKGAWILHMLRYVLGDELFWKGIHNYIMTNQKKLVETPDLKKAFEEGTGKNLYWFFNEWVYSGGYPKFLVEKTWCDSLHAVALHVSQTQIHDTLTTVFRMPIKIQSWFGNHQQTYSVEISTADTTFYLKCKRNPDAVLFDPGNHILKKIYFKRNKDELLAQLAHATAGIDRLDALDALKDSYLKDKEVQHAVASRLTSDSFWVVRRNAARFLGNVKEDWAKEILLKALHDPKSHVREAAVLALGNTKDSTLVSAIQNVFQTDSSYAVLGACIQAITGIDSIKALPLLKKALTMKSYNEIIRRAAVRAIGSLNSPDGVDLILSYGSSKYPVRLRTTVIRSLMKIGKDNPRAVDFLIKCLSDSSNWIRRQTTFVLSRIGGPEAIGPLEKAFKKETNERVKKSMKMALKHLKRKKEIAGEKNK